MIELPQKIVCVGLNYRDHAEEQGVDAARAAAPLREVAEHADRRRASRSGSRPICEAPRLRGRARRRDRPPRARVSSVDDALDFVRGYVVANDVSGRDLQFSDGQWVRGKSLDTFLPVGDLVPVSEVPDPQVLPIRAILNGEVDAGLEHVEPGLRRRRGRLVRLAGDHARARRPDHHRHARGRRRIPRAARSGCSRATRSRSRSTGSARSRTRSSQRNRQRERATMSFVLVVRMKVEEGNEETRSRRSFPSSRARAGRRRAASCTFPCRRPGGPALVHLLRAVRDKAAFEEHGASEHFQRLGAGELFGLMESRERTFYETVVD